MNCPIPERYRRFFRVSFWVEAWIERPTFSQSELMRANQAAHDLGRAYERVIVGPRVRFSRRELNVLQTALRVFLNRYPAIEAHYGLSALADKCSAAYEAAGDYYGSARSKEFVRKNT